MDQRRCRKASQRSVELPRNHIHLWGLDMESCSTATWEARWRNEEAGGSGAGNKHSEKACVCETFNLGQPNLDITWSASVFLVCNLTLGWPVRWHLTHVSQSSFRSYSTSSTDIARRRKEQVKYTSGIQSIRLICWIQKFFQRPNGDGYYLLTG